MSVAPGPDAEFLRLAFDCNLDEGTLSRAWGLWLAARPCFCPEVCALG